MGRWQRDQNTDPQGTSGQVVQGRTAPQWAEQLEARNHVQRKQASMVLGKMGERGYPHLREGMRRGSTEVRLACMQAIGKPALLEHRGEMVPILRAMLRDPEPMLRRAAAARLCWFGADARSAVRELQYIAEHDDHPDIQQVAQGEHRIGSEPQCSAQSRPPTGRTATPLKQIGAENDD